MKMPHVMTVLVGDYKIKIWTVLPYSVHASLELDFMIAILFVSRWKSRSELPGWS